ncbi:MAG: hypothetical protein Q4B26_10140, partial [Eubacteriales bacterium]|nr:hypothetical protein [Eubacteriales bacterium]
NEYLENKKYDDAIEAYSRIEDEQLRNRKINGANYVHGMNLYNTKQYDLAIKQFKKCGEYRDAPVYVKREERYQLAISTMENHQFAKAADMFVDLEDYRASASYLKEMKSKCSEYVTDTGDETRVRGFGEDLAKEAAVKANEALGNTLWTMTLYKDLEEITGESDGRYDASKIHDYIIENLDGQTMMGMIDLMALGDTSRYTNGEELGHGKEVYTEIGNAMWKISQKLKKHDTVTDDEILDIYEKEFRTCLDQMRAWLDELK